MKKSNNRRNRLQSLDTAQLAQVAGGHTPQQNAGYHLYTIGADFEPGSGYYEFFYAAGTAVMS